MTSISRQLRAELRYLHYTRSLLILLGLLAAGVAIATSGSVSSARSSHEFFVGQVATFEKNGISLEDALRTPVTVTGEGGMETIDNPLKYDYLAVGQSVRAVQGIALVGTALDLVTFIFAPLLFLMLGANLATYDRTSRTLALRASRERWGRVTAGKILALVAIAAMATAAVAILALIAAAVASPSVHGLMNDINYDLAVPESKSPLILKLLMTSMVCTFFGVVGYAVGVVTRSASWPMVLAALALFLMPFVTRWDPRNLLAVMGSRVYDFWGQFEMRPPIPLGSGTALAVLLGYLAGAGAVVVLSARSIRLT
ncbi:MAG: hypothetical protein ACOYEV_01745 [Candidatus Nanopelagicales bacterium]